MTALVIVSAIFCVLYGIATGKGLWTVVGCILAITGLVLVG